ATTRAPTGHRRAATRARRWGCAATTSTTREQPPKRPDPGSPQPEEGPLRARVDRVDPRSRPRRPRRQEHDTIDVSGRGGRLPSMSMGRTAGNDMETTG